MGQFVRTELVFALHPPYPIRSKVDSVRAGRCREGTGTVVAGPLNQQRHLQGTASCHTCGEHVCCVVYTVLDITDSTRNGSDSITGDYAVRWQQSKPRWRRFRTVLQHRKQSGSVCRRPPQGCIQEHGREIAKERDGRCQQNASKIHSKALGSSGLVGVHWKSDWRNSKGGWPDCRISRSH